MPRASKRTNAKKSPEIRYEPQPNIVRVNLTRDNKFIQVWEDTEFSGCFFVGNLSGVIDELARLEKALHYEKVINNAVHK